MENYKQIPDTDWETVKSVFSINRYSKGDILVRTGDALTCIYYIIEGGVRHYCFDGNGREYTTDFCLENEFSGSFESAEGTPPVSDQWITVFEESVIAAADCSRFGKLVLERPVYQHIFSSVLIEYHRLKIEREKYLLSTDLDSRYDAFIERYASLLRRVPHYQIASFLGMTPETLSRIRKRGGHTD